MKRRITTTPPTSQSNSFITPYSQAFVSWRAFSNHTRLKLHRTNEMVRPNVARTKASLMEGLGRGSAAAITEIKYTHTA